jgi:hypothetical protein
MDRLLPLPASVTAGRQAAPPRWRLRAVVARLLGAGPAARAPAAFRAGCELRDRQATNRQRLACPACRPPAVRRPDRPAATTGPGRRRHGRGRGTT